MWAIILINPATFVSQTRLALRGKIVKWRGIFARAFWFAALWLRL